MNKSQTRTLLLTLMLSSPIAILAGCDSPDSSLEQTNQAVDTATQSATETVEKTVEDVTSTTEKTE